MTATVLVDGTKLASTSVEPDSDLILSVLDLLDTRVEHGEAHVLKCQCGRFDCVGLRTGIHVRHTPGLTRWVFDDCYFPFLLQRGLVTGEAREVTMTFDREAYVQAIADAESKIMVHELPDCTIPLSEQDAEPGTFFAKAIAFDNARKKERKRHDLVETQGVGRYYVIPGPCALVRVADVGESLPLLPRSEDGALMGVGLPAAHWVFRFCGSGTKHWRFMQAVGDFEVVEALSKDKSALKL